jgi:uncharacterized protein YbjT (DUF2867 family)
MANGTSTILAVGAAGKFAGLVVPALAKRGAKVRGLIQKAAQADEVLKHGASEVAVGDLRDRASLDVALKDVSSVFYIAPAFRPDEAAIGIRMVEAAKQAGVRRFVFSSVIHPVLSRLPNHARKAPVEEAVLDSHLEYTFLHPTVLFQNYAGAWNRIVETGVLAEPWSNETRFSRVDYRDVAEVAAIALTGERLLYGTFELCADGWLDRHEVASLIREVLGRPITPQKVDPASLPAAAQAMRPMFEHYDRIGLRGNALTLAAILGRAPRTLRAYFEELAAYHSPSGDGE